MFRLLHGDAVQHAQTEDDHDREQRPAQDVEHDPPCGTETGMGQDRRDRSERNIITTSSTTAPNVSASALLRSFTKLFGRSDRGRR